MNTHRISTTISQKHWEMLKKHTEELGTQQKVLEFALESLENSSKQNPELIREDRYWTCIKATKTACFVQKDGLKMLMETAKADLFKEYVIQHKPMEYNIEYYFQKPLKECSLKEVIDGMVIISRTSNWFDTVDYTDKDDHHTLMFTHSLGLNNSIINKILFESLFETYGVRVKSILSEKTIFMKILKN